ncbi:MAG: integration host factor subunit alpha [Hydrogenophaga sp.]|jgi:integration host factor subunit alpha|uniref:integration host factor subunit alpha n=1 Tax=Hydrogenophaga sp. TaxID=1904254 RepID=UPI0025B90BD0|nr:integration host factor subunit alpha [Hydrogenophaga sp.]MBT9550645.1 integration host factor subunit alpha [Hydrogenophaga sp.]
MNLLIDDLEISSLTKTQIVQMLADQIGLSHREARDVVDGFFDILTSKLAEGKNVKLASFGNFELRNKNTRPGRNLHTGEPVDVKARRSVKFFAGPKLRRQMVGEAGPNNAAS